MPPTGTAPEEKALELDSRNQKGSFARPTTPSRSWLSYVACKAATVRTCERMARKDRSVEDAAQSRLAST